VRRGRLLLGGQVASTRRSTTFTPTPIVVRTGRGTVDERVVDVRFALDDDDVPGAELAA